MRARRTRTRARAAWAASLGAVAISLALVPTASASTTLIGSGSSGAQPYMLALFAGYHQIHSNISFRYNPDGGNAGVQDVQAGRSEFAINTRPPLPSDQGTVYYKLFLDALCIAVNPSNHLSDISLSQLKDIFLGTDTSWDQIPGADLGKATIDPVGRNSSAGAYTFFQQAVLGGETQSSNVFQASSDGLVAIHVKNDKDAIGYVGLSHSGSGSGVKKVSVGGVACDDAQIRSENYPLFRYDWGVLPIHNPNTQVEEFFDWVRTSHRAGQILQAAGAVPAFNQGF